MDIEEDIKKVKELNNLLKFFLTHGWIPDLSREINTNRITEAIDHILAERVNDKKEIKELKHINSKLRTIRVEHEYGYENTNLLLKEDMTYIGKNKYFIEVEEGKMVDVKQLYLDNLNSIPKQKVKEELERAEKENKSYEKYKKESRAYWINQGKISLAKKLLEDK